MQDLTLVQARIRRLSKTSGTDAGGKRKLTRSVQQVGMAGHVTKRVADPRWENDIALAYGAMQT